MEKINENKNKSKFIKVENDVCMDWNSCELLFCNEWISSLKITFTIGYVFWIVWIKSNNSGSRDRIVCEINKISWYTKYVKNEATKSKQIAYGIFVILFIKWIIGNIK